MAKIVNDPTTKRTRAHIIASQSQNYMEKLFIDAGHTADRPSDYGTDLLVTTFDKKGYAENGYVILQLKASDSLKYSASKSYISYSIERKHYNLWRKEPMPVFMILYHAKRKRAYWLYVQDYFALGNKPKKNSNSLTVRVPVRNGVSRKTVTYIRSRKAAVLKSIEGNVQHEA